MNQLKLMENCIQTPFNFSMNLFKFKFVIKGNKKEPYRVMKMLAFKGKIIDKKKKN